MYLAFCEKCNKAVPQTETHHIIPIAILKARKYQVVPTVDNTIELCHECHEQIHHKFRPDKWNWKILCNKTYKMRKVEKLDKLILEMKVVQMDRQV